MMGLKTVFVAPLGKVLKNGKGVLLSTYFNFNVNFFKFQKKSFNERRYINGW